MVVGLQSYEEKYIHVNLNTIIIYLYRYLIYMTIKHTKFINMFMIFGIPCKGKH